MPLADIHLIPDDIVVDGLLGRAVTRAPNQVAIRTERSEITFGALGTEADRCAAALAAATDPGASVGLAMVLDPVFAIAFYGIARAGNVIVTVNPLLREAVLEHNFRTAGIQVAFVTAEMAGRLAAVRDRMPDLRAVVIVAGAPAPPDTVPFPGAVPFADFLAAAPASVSPRGPVTDPARVACIQFTSGTTGAPKAVLLSHRNVVANAVQVAVAHGLNQDSVTVNHIPGYHLMHLNSAVYAGATQVLCRDPDPAAPVEMANRYRADRIYGLPMRLARLAADPRLPDMRLDTVAAILSGGSALPARPAERLSARFGIPVLQGYGLAETSPLTHCDRLDRPKRDSVGYPVTGTECRVVHIERRVPLPQREKGEVQVRGPQLMLGYLGQPNPPEIDADGWFSTGDVGYLDADGALFLIDRIKDVFKCDNELVAPTEIERVLSGHPSVADCVVLDYPDEFSGAVPYALVVLHEPTDPSPLDAITEYVNERVATFQRLRHIDATELIPRSATGKLERRALRDQLLFRNRTESGSPA